MDNKSHEIFLNVNPEQDKLLQELILTYTKEVGSLIQYSELPYPKEWKECSFKYYSFKKRLIGDAWILLHRPQTPIRFPSFRMNGCSYRITRNNKLIFRTGPVNHIFNIQLGTERLSREEQGVLTIFKDYRGWMIQIEPKKIQVKKDPLVLNALNDRVIIW